MLDNDLDTPSGCQVWLEASIKLSQQIIDLLTDVQHCQDLSKRLVLKMEGSILVLINLREDYVEGNNSDNRSSYDLAFKNYYNTIKLCLEFVQTFQDESTLSRFLFKDEFKSKFHDCFKEIDMAVELLQLNLAVQIKLNRKISKDYITTMENNFQSLKKKVDGLDKRIIKMNNLRTTFKLDQFTITDTYFQITKYMVDKTELIELPDASVDSKFFIVKKRMYKDTLIVEKKPKQQQFLIDSETIKSELRNLSKLRLCNNIVHYLGYIQLENISLLTEYCELGNLNGYLEKYKLGITSKVNFTLDIVTAITYLHDLNLCHNFLNTFTVYVTQDLRCKVGDLELKYCSSVDNYYRLQPIQFSSPEILDEDNCNISSKANDIFALATVIWSIWSNRQPYIWLDLDAIRSHIKGGDRELLTKIKPNVLVVKHTIERAWLSDPEARPTAEHILKRFEVLVPMALIKDPRHKDKLKEVNGSNPVKILDGGDEVVLDDSFFKKGLDFEQSFSNLLDISTQSDKLIKDAEIVLHEAVLTQPNELIQPTILNEGKDEKSLTKMYNRQVRVNYNPSKCMQKGKVFSHDKLMEKKLNVIQPLQPTNLLKIDKVSTSYPKVRTYRNAVPTFILKKDI